MAHTASAGLRRGALRGLAGLLAAAALPLLTLAGCATGPIERGDAAMASEDWAAALAAYEAALEESPGDPRILGRIRSVRERLAGDRLERARRQLDEGHPVAAWAEARAVMEEVPGMPEARMLLEESEQATRATVRQAVDRGAWDRALSLISRAEAAGLTAIVPPERRLEVRRRVGAVACAAAEDWAEQGLWGNALLAWRRAAELEGPCEALMRAEAARAELAHALALDVSVALEGDAVPGLRRPLARWVVETGSPVRLDAPPSEAELRVTGSVEIRTDRAEKGERLTLERQVDVRQVANPEYVSLDKQRRQLESEIENARLSLWNASREVENLYRAWLRTGSEAIRTALYEAQRRLEDAQQRYNDLVGSYQILAQKLSGIQQLLERPVMETAEVDAQQVQVEATARGQARVEAEGLGPQPPISLDYEVRAQDWAWEAQEDRVPANELTLPGQEQLVRRLGEELGERILDRLKEEIRRRADALEAEGLAAREAGREVEAVEAFVRALVLDPEGARPPVRQWLAEVRSAELPQPGAGRMARGDGEEAPGQEAPGGGQ